MKTYVFHTFSDEWISSANALVKAASAFVSGGKKVFVLDLDVWSPSLHFEFLTNAQLNALGSGFVEFAQHFVAQGFTPRDLSQYTVQTNGMTLMPAGCALYSDYWVVVAGEGGLDFRVVFNHEQALGLTLLSILKIRIEQELDPDVLLINAPSGITPMGKSLLGDFADAVIGLSTDTVEGRWGAALVKGLCKTRYISVAF